MAYGTQQHQYQPQQQQQLDHHRQPRQEMPMSQQHNNLMPFAANQGLNACLDSQQQMHQTSSASPVAFGPTMGLDSTQWQVNNISPHHQQQQQQQQHMSMRSPVLNQEMCNQQANQHHMHRKTQLLPKLLSPRSSGPEVSDQADQSRLPENDHDQIIEQVISLENDFSNPSSAMTNIDNEMGLIVNNQPQHQLQQHPGDTNFTSGPCMPGANQLSSSSEDLLNLLLEFDGDSTDVASGQQMDQDEKMGIETIRKQLMSCEVQSNQHNSITTSPTMNQQSSSSPQQVRVPQQSQVYQMHHGFQHQHQPIPQTPPIISHDQTQLSGPGPSQQQQQQQHHHRLSVDQTLLHGQYTNSHLGNTVPVSTSISSHTTNNEPSPVVKKNPLLNAQLVNSRAPSVTPTRFMSNQANVLNQNPILNSKLSQNSQLVANSRNSVGSPVNPSMESPQPPYIQQQQSSSYSYGITQQQQQQQQNAQQHTPPQTGYMSIYEHSDCQQQQQQPNHVFRNSNSSTTCTQPEGPSQGGGGFSQQVKQGIRKKVQQNHQTTSLLKQLLSDDNK